MYSREYVIGTIDNVKKVVNIASGCIEDIDPVKGRYVVDMKSILGVFSLDLSRPAEVHVYTEDEARAEEIFAKIDEALRG